jgi:hypothetical protein
MHCDDRCDHAINRAIIKIYPVVLLHDEDLRSGFSFHLVLFGLTSVEGPSPVIAFAKRT